MLFHLLPLVSEAPKAAPVQKKYDSFDPKMKSDDEKKEELIAAMITKMGDKDEDPLPQDEAEGVDSDEWVGVCVCVCVFVCVCRYICACVCVEGGREGKCEWRGEKKHVRQNY